MNPKRAYFANLGAPPIPIVPVTDFDRLPYDMLKQAWWIVGVSADRNLSRCAIWEVIAAAYLEGMNHGYEFSQQQRNVKMENEPQAEMPRYKCHKEVHALKIAAITLCDGGARIAPEEKG